MARKTQKSLLNNKQKSQAVEATMAVMARENGENVNQMTEKGGEKKMAATITRTEEELREIRFVFRGDGAESVKLAGTFTDWEKGAVEMVRGRDGEWSINVKLASGEYQYKFLIDGEWRNDPNAQAEVWSDMGTTNSWMSID